MNRRSWLELTSAAAFAAGGLPRWPRTRGRLDAMAPFRRLPFGAVRPAGWLQAQMLGDLTHGFAGRMDALCHEVASDIFVSSRNSRHAMNLANQDGVAWWNGESEGNWRAGHLMLAGLTGEPAALDRGRAYVARILASQDADGYLGAYAADLRDTREGDLWTQACLLRGLLAWSELTGDPAVFRAVERAARRTMAALEAGRWTYPWKEHHDLMFADVLEQLHEHTGDAAYPAFALRMYDTWNAAVPRTDTSLATLRDPAARWTDHGVHTYEILRLPLWLAAATGRPDLVEAAHVALGTLARYTLPSGAAVSQEWIEDAAPHPSLARYEYCAMKEVLVTLQAAFRTRGDAALGDWLERLFFNALQGARHPDGTGISYLTRDNRTRCGSQDRDGKRRDKFSPVHADVAVCCNPNATQVAAHFVRGLWMRHPAGGLAAMAYGPSVLRTRVRDVAVEVRAHTTYPFGSEITLEVIPAAPVRFPLWLRNPAWSGGTVVRARGASVEPTDGFVRVEREWRAGDRVEIGLAPSVQAVVAVTGEVALAHGALLYAEPLAAEATTLRQYDGGFADTEYEAGRPEAPAALERDERARGYGFAPGPVAAGEPSFADPGRTLQGRAVAADGTVGPLTLVPLGSAPITRWLTRPLI